MNNENIISAQVKLLQFAVSPGILGGIACFIGPPLSASIKVAIGVVIDYAIQQRYFVSALKDVMQVSHQLFDEIFGMKSKLYATGIF